MMTHLQNRAMGTVLIVSRDSIASRQIGDIFREHALDVEFSVDASAAVERLNRRKFEAVVVESSIASEAAACLRSVRSAPSNRTVVTFALTSGKDNTARALRDGFGFALERPLTPDSIRHTLRAAYGLIVRERRRYFRYSVNVPVTFSRRGIPEVFGRTVNISECGIALRTSTPLPPGTEGTAHFTLPGLPREIRAECRVRWSHEDGEAGFSFLFLPFNIASELQSWLAQKLEEELPPVVIEKFREASLRGIPVASLHSEDSCLQLV